MGGFEINGGGLKLMGGGGLKLMGGLGFPYIQDQVIQ